MNNDQSTYYPANKRSQKPAIFVFSIFTLAAFIYLTQYTYIEVPNRYYGSDKVVNHAGLWAGFGIAMMGPVFGAILWSLTKCREEMTCIRELMNAQAGRTNEQPAPEALTAEENTYAHQAPAETKHP